MFSNKGHKFYGTATVGTKGQIVIPAEAREELEIKENDKLVVIRAPHGHGFVVLKADAFEKFLNKMRDDFGSMAESVKTSK